MAKLTVAVLALAAAVVAASPSGAFYLPGIAPVAYEEGAKAEVLAARLTSVKNKVPYDIYSLPLCKPPAGLPRNKRHLSLGQVLVGERAQPTGFELNVLVPATCKVLCEFEVPVGAPLRRLHRRITDEYVVRLNLDNMPVVTRLNVAAAEAATAAPSFMLGYPLGVSDVNGAAYLYNHLKFRVLYHKPSATDVAAAAASAAAVASGTTRAPAYRIVGFEVEPMSVTHKMVEGEITTCPVNGSTAVPLAVPTSTADKSPTAALSNAITYDVEWVASDRAWATRWDALLNANSAQVQIQWFSVVNSVMIALFLAGMVALILLRTVHADFARYNRLDGDDDLADDAGWKLVHGDVFRAPTRAAALAIAVGTGAQVTAVTVITLVFALLGLLSPANRGGLLSAMLLLWALTGAVPGFVSAVLYGRWGGMDRKKVTLGAGMAYPGLVGTLFFSLNLMLWAAGSTMSVSFFTLLLLLALWLFVAMPLCIVGAYGGYKVKTADWPTRVNAIARAIPRPPMGVSPSWYALATGILCFGVVFIELVMVLTSQLYYMFGFLFIVFALLVVSCAEVSIVFVYLSLTHEDWRWWWNAFNYTASSGLWVFAYSLWFYTMQSGLEWSTHLLSSTIFFVYSAIASSAFALMTGSIGFTASYIFVNKIYSAVRVE
eukprot:TRINITY_DN362_c0_g1_i8.p1 TRINITY_DN362_c0_g1~~TRINITY_DN362_c0_g1_i8.p1  ORF type:complete len:659 (+),score=233.66 TRINITY_DN362_c0_g1_i8:107-2083(+)